MHKVLIANPKGGVGKSTIATNLAGWYAKAGQRVMLGDIDRQQSSRGWLRVRSPSLPAIASWDIRPGEPARPPKGTTHVILDTPAGLHGKRLKEVLPMVSDVIIPLQPSLFDIYATRHFIDELLDTKQYRSNALRLGLVAMRVDARTKAAAEIERFLEGTGLPVVAHLRDTQNYVQAAAHGMSIFDLPGMKAKVDCDSWQPLLRWVNRE
jgi:chromosome partitioning protein